jgi:pimeloyl-ACP methyl ester carboxylesterase
LGFVKRFAAGLVAGAAGVAYGKAILARNRGLDRPPITDTDGEPYDIGLLELSDGEIVEYVDVGEGPPILWIPGADGPKETFRYQLPHFAAAHRVVSADLRVRIHAHHDLDRIVDDFVELQDSLEMGPCIVVGQSFGSAVAMRLAVRARERVRGIVLANPVARISYDHVGLNRVALVPLARGTTKYLPTPLSRLIARALWSPFAVWLYDDSAGREGLIEYALNTGPRTTPASVSGARVRLLEAFDLREELWSLEVPALVVKGPDDSYCPVSWALEIADLLPDARYVPIPGTGHCSHISRPGAFNQVLESWLESRFDRIDGEDG